MPMLRLLLLIPAFLFAGLHTAAQGLSVESFTLLPNDMTARTLSPERDANGELTAVIKVVTTATGFDFETGALGITKVAPKTGEYWVYVPAKSRNLTIKHPQLGILRNYAYPLPIQAGSVYELKLVHGEVEVTVKERQLLTEYVIITSAPSGADVYLNNEPVGKTPFTAEKEEGRYAWRVVSDLYLPEAGAFELKAGEKQKLDITLKPDFGTLDLVSLPEEGATISLNGVKLGKTTPAKIEEVPSGEQTLTLTHEWYETTTQKVNVVAGRTEQVRITMQPNFAELTVEAKADEEVFVNDSRKGMGTWTGRVSPGVYRIEVRKASHTPATKQITLSRGDRERVGLAPEPILSNLKVVSDPIDADIYLNGQLMGSTPHIVRDLLVGEYELELRKQGYGTCKQTVKVKEGEVVEVSVTLTSTGAIAFTSEPSGADVYINSSYMGRTPYTVSDLPSGNHNYELRKEGYDTFKGNATVDAGITARVFKTLNSRRKPYEPEMVLVEGGTFTMGCTSEQGDDRIASFYEALKADGIPVPESVEQFKTAFATDESSKAFHEALKADGIPVPESYEDFTLALGLRNYCYDDETPSHRVTLSSFQIGKYEVTQAQWRAVMGSNPSEFSGCDDCPVEWVSWNDIQDFIRKLNEQTGKNYRLPTEAEWEYAARGGTKSKGYKYAGSNDINSVAWYWENSNKRTHAVGGKKENELGIYDMTGNVLEWCEDWYGDYSSASQTNPKGPSSGSRRLLRGGSWRNRVEYCRVSIRNDLYSGNRSSGNGFRLVLPAP